MILHWQHLTTSNCLLCHIKDWQEVHLTIFEVDAWTSQQFSKLTKVLLQEYKVCGSYLEEDCYSIRTAEPYICLSWSLKQWSWSLQRKIAKNVMWEVLFFQLGSTCQLHAGMNMQAYKPQGPDCNKGCKEQILICSWSWSKKLLHHLLYCGCAIEVFAHHGSLRMGSPSCSLSFRPKMFEFI